VVVIYVSSVNFASIVDNPLVITFRYSPWWLENIGTWSDVGYRHEWFVRRFILCNCVFSI